MSASRAGWFAAARRIRGEPRLRASRAKSSLRAVLLCRRGSKPRPATLRGAPYARDLGAETRQQPPQEPGQEAALHAHGLVAPDQRAKRAQGEPRRAPDCAVAPLDPAKRGPFRRTQGVAESLLQRSRLEHQPAVVLEVADPSDRADRP